MQILDLYKSRFGSDVKQQGNGWNGPCPLCGGEPGHSDRFVVWPERTENGSFSRGATCIEHNIAGVWSCRRCGAGGDTIAYLMQIDGLSFKAALAELGIAGERRAHHRRAAPSEPRQASAFVPQSWPDPSPTWRAYAEKLLDEASSRIFSEPRALAWLAARGINAEAIRTYQIGYLPAEGNTYPGRWRYRSALGLEPKQKDDGTVSQKIFIPRGIVIPSFAPRSMGGALLNLRIRRHVEDLQTRPNGKKQAKYMELEGSNKAPLLLAPSGSAHLAAWFVTEAELDAMLIHHATGGTVGALAVRTNRGKPDAQAHERLSASVRVCVALDYDAELDADGNEHVPADAPGSQGLDWWEETYALSLRWPTPEGKDPGEAFKLGVDIREWVAAALPGCWGAAPNPVRGSAPLNPRQGHDAPAPPIVERHFPPTERHLCGRMDASASGLQDVGGGAKPENVPLQEGGPAGLSQMPASGNEATSLPAPYAEAFSSEELARLNSALPADCTLTDVPIDVCRAWLLWQGVPASFSKQRDADGNTAGFSWDYDPSWRRTHEAAFEAFWMFQDGSRELWNWLSCHSASKITSRNLLNIWR